jgi:hypothetical protein
MLASVIIAKLYKLGTAGMSNFLNLPLQELLGPIPSMIPLLFFVLKYITRGC